MVLSYTVLGSLMASRVYWDRMGAILLIYFLGLGIAAHALDALGSKGLKPWGNVFTKKQLWLAVIFSLATAYGVAAYYIIRHVPLLTVIALVEGFFVFAYNLEWFGGRFHTDLWFAFSWGYLPVVAGYAMQTNSIGPAVLLMGMAAFFFSLIEIKASRPYKDLRRRQATLSEQENQIMTRYELILKCISLGVCFTAAGLLGWRL